MNEREHMEYLVEIGDDQCESDMPCEGCPLNSEPCGDYTLRVAFAKQWLASHPEEPKAKPEKIYKSASRGELIYSLTVSNGRISLYRWHGKDSESMDFSGTVDDLGQFDETHPEEWFDVAAKMIAGRK